MKPNTLPLFFLMLIATGSANADAAADTTVNPDQAAKQVRINLKQPAWQIRRGDFATAANTLRQNPKDDKARQKVDQVVTGFDKNPLSRTPMEAMEILGAIHLHRDGIKQAMPLIVAEAVLGWYDALLWGSDTGRGEIEKNERLFTRALLIGGGNKAVGDWADLLEKNPKMAISLVNDGIARATKLHAHEKNAYDHKWPAAYSLERTLAAMTGKPEPAVTKSNMSEDKAWKAAVEKVRDVYTPMEK
jgi:hypothetical protein